MEARGGHQIINMADHTQIYIEPTGYYDQHAKFNWSAILKKIVVSV